MRTRQTNALVFAFLIFFVTIVNCSEKISKSQMRGKLSSTVAEAMNKSKKLFKDASEYEEEKQLLGQEGMTLEETIDYLSDNIEILKEELEYSKNTIPEIKNAEEKEMAIQSAQRVEENIKVLTEQLGELMKLAKKEIKQLIKSEHIAEEVTEEIVKLEHEGIVHEQKETYESTPALVETKGFVLRVKIPNKNKIPVPTSGPSAGLWKSENNALRGAELAGECLKAFMSVIPPSFCYKKGADAGVIPTGCAPGWFRSLALCYEHCRPGYTHVLGVCWEVCSSGYTDMGLTCFKWNWFNSKSYWKGSHIPASRTNFDSVATCNEGYYKSGALCYRNCENIFMVNCGIGACAASSEACAAGIINIVVDVVLGAIQFGVFIASFGTSSSAQGGVEGGKSMLKSAYNAVKAKAKHIFDMTKRIATNPQARKKFLDATLKKFKEFVIKKVVHATIQKVTEEVCEKIGNEVFDDIAKRNQPGLNENAWDPTGLSNAVKDCDKEMVTENDKIMCSRSVISVISMVDPTGLASIAAGVLQPICDV